MKLAEVVRFEVGYQLRRRWTWFYFLALFGITFQFTMEAFTGGAEREGYFFNSPFVVVSVTLFITMVALVVMAATSGDAAARDVQTRMHPLVYTSSLGTGTYLGGRFLAAFLLNAGMLLAAQLALLLTTAMKVGPGLTGPFQPLAYLGSWVAVALPGAFVATAFLFSIAALSRRPVAAYLAAVLLFFGSVTVYLLLALKLNRWDLAKLLDPMSLTALGEMTRTSTAAEKNSLGMLTNPWMFANRGIWIAVSVAVLGATWYRFRFEHAVAGSWRRAAVVPSADRPGPARSGPVMVPRAPRAFGFRTRLRQVSAIAGQSFREVAFSWGGLLLVAMGTILVFAAPSALSHMGIPLLPTTQEMIGFVGNTGEMLWTVVPLLTAYYVGELVWRDRETGLSEIADAAPVSEGVRYAGRLAGLGLVLAAYQLLLTIACILVQVRLGYFRFELPLYLRVMLGLQLGEHLLFAVLAFAVHVTVNHKYAGHMVLLVAYAVTTCAPQVGIDHNMLPYGSAPDWTYTDMRGFASTLAPYLWLKAYWWAWALLLAVGTAIFWVRGREPGLAARLRSAHRHLAGSAGAVAAMAVALILVLGGFVFWNTNVRNDYLTRQEQVARRVGYERAYGRYAGAPQPQVAGMALRVEIRPDRRAVEIAGTYTLVNTTGVAIDSIHLAPQWGIETGPATLDRAAALVLDDAELGHRIYALASPLMPGDSTRLAFSVRSGPNGFGNEGADLPAAPGATFFEADGLIPALGYRRGRELDAAAARAGHGLPPARGMRSLEDAAAGTDRMDAGRLAFEAIVGTDPDQVGVAPGTLRRTWRENGRRYFHYVSDVPIANDIRIYSSAYAVRRSQWKDVGIEVLYHPAHTSNLDGMMASLRASLDYFTTHFGPYPHRQIRLVEEPDDGNSLHSGPVAISYEEGFAIFNPTGDARELDFPFAVIAHEVAHEWWGHQVRPARAEGAALLSESLAWYSAMAVVRAHRGDEQLRRLLDMMREAYLTPRARADVPLLRSHDWYTAYRKGPFAMYALSEYLGQQRVNTALRSLLARYRAGTPPLPTSLDLYRELQAVTPDSLRYLLVDLLAVNTFWALKTNTVSAERGASGWKVTLDVSAGKVAVDTAGVETPLPMNDLVEIGVYGAGEEGSRGAPLYLRLHRIRPGAQRITVMVDSEPAAAGIDPRNLLIDTEGGDNVADVPRDRDAGAVRR